MKGYFSKLAYRTGVRIGAGDAPVSPTPVGPAPPPRVAPLEVEELRDAAPGPVREFERREPPAPTREPEPRTLSAGSLPGIRRIGPPDPPSQQSRPIEEMPVVEERGVHAVTHEISGIERFETRIAPSVPEMPAPREAPAVSGAAPLFESGRGGHPAEPSAADLPGLDLLPVQSREREGAIARAEEYAVGMREEDRAHLFETDATTVPRSREEIRDRMLREVIEWISSPAAPQDGDEAMRSIREIESMGGTLPADRYAGPSDMRDSARAPMRPRDGEAAREPEFHDFTLSIGSIRVVIEEPGDGAAERRAPEQKPQQAAHVEGQASRTASGDSSRLSRHYITFG